MAFIKASIVILFIIAGFYTAQLSASRDGANEISVWPIATIYKDRDPVKYWIVFWGLLVSDVVLLCAVMWMIVL